MGAKATQPKMRLGNTTDQDDENNVMLPAHAYLCNQDGVIEVRINQSTSIDQIVIAYDDSDSNPIVGGDMRRRWSTGVYGEDEGWDSFNFTMQKGRYFEITVSGTIPPSLFIRWCPFGTLLKCTDYN